MTIIGYILIAIGIFSGIWGGVNNPIDLSDSNFMAYLSGAFVLIMIGLLFLKMPPLWAKVLAIAISILSVSVYLYGLHWASWLFWLSVGTLLIIGVALSIVIFRRASK